jgi:hypothetical protein
VTLLDVDGKRIEQVTGVIGSYDGSKAIKIEESGVYLLNIAADEDWTVSVD